MRTFSCFVFSEDSSVPILSFIVAADEQRARQLALREARDEPRPCAVELCEGGKLLWGEKFKPLARP